MDKFKIPSMFNQIAHRYDFLNHFLSLGIDTIWRRKALSYFSFHKDSLVLDLATGTGDLALLALKKGATMVVGLDPAHAMLRQAQKKVRPQTGQFVLVEAFAEEIPFQSEVFSHAMVAYGIRNVSDREKTFQEIYRVLKKNGELLILEFGQIEKPLLAQLFHFYFHYLLPKLGGWISGHREAYRYLPQSVAHFIGREKLIAEAVQRGFAHKKTKLLFGGLSVIYLFTKRS